MMRKYIKRPVEVDAVQWDGNNRDEIFKFCSMSYVTYNPGSTEPVLNINTLEGVMKADIGDYIIKGIKGEFYPCKKEIFNLTYISCDGK